MRTPAGPSTNINESDPRSWFEAFDRFANTYSEKFIIQLISVPSVNPPGNEAAASKTLASLLEPLDVSCELQYIASDRANLLATVGSTDGRRRLALCSHLDVVAPGETSTWTSDPLTPRRVNDLIYGRGSCDAKGCLAAMALSMAFLAQRPDLLPGSLLLMAVASEELGGIGSNYLMQSDCPADSVIIGEPTNMRIALGHKGRIEVDVVIRGRSGHASTPHAAMNPIDTSGRVVDILKKLGDHIANCRHPHVGAASLAITTIRDDGTHTNTFGRSGLDARSTHSPHRDTRLSGDRVSIRVISPENLRVPALQPLIATISGLLLSPFLGVALLYRAVTVINLAKVGVIRGIMPVFVLVAAFIVFRSIPSARQVTGGIISVGGVFLIYGHGVSAIEDG